MTVSMMAVSLAMSVSVPGGLQAAAEEPLLTTAAIPEELPPAAPMPEPTEGGPPKTGASSPADATAAKAAADPDSAKAGTTKPPRDGRCDACGGCDAVRRVCVAVPVEREKIKVCWSYRCEEVCIPGPSVFCGETCERDDCGPWWKAIWQPTCARVITKHVPVKNEVKRKLPGVDWQVQERCCHCRGPASSKESWFGYLLHPFGPK